MRTDLCPGANCIDTMRSETGMTQSLGQQSWALSHATDARPAEKSVTSEMFSVVEYAQHDPHCPWSFTSDVAPNTLQSMDDGVAARSESVTVSLSVRACNT